MKLTISEVKNTLIQALVKRGIAKKNAETVANEYLEGELQNRLSHGLMAFPSALEKADLKTKKPKIIKKTASSMFIDANYNFGAVVGRVAAEQAIKMARRQGVALVVLKNLTTWLRPGTIATWISEKGFIGLVANNGGKPMVAPPGGYDPVIATNPIGIGIPTLENPILVDMATSKRAWGEVRLCEKQGRDLPPATFLDKNGRFAVKAQDAYSVLPAGDYKGFAIGLLIEILTGSLADLPMGPHKLTGDYRTIPRGGFILVINPASFTTAKRFKNANSELVREIKSSGRLLRAPEILIPGERAMRSKKENLDKGYLEIDDGLWQKIKNG